MKIGATELRQNISKYLKMVEQGKTINVIKYGKKICVMSPNNKTDLQNEGLSKKKIADNIVKEFENGYGGEETPEETGEILGNCALCEKPQTELRNKWEDGECHAICKKCAYTGGSRDLFEQYWNTLQLSEPPRTESTKPNVTLNPTATYDGSVKPIPKPVKKKKK